MRLRGACALCASLLAAGPVAAQDKPPPAPELRLVPAPGKPVGFTVRFESSSTATTPGERAGQARVSVYEMSIALETGAADASGALPVTLRVERVTGKAERMGRGSYEFDSEAALPDDFMRRCDVFNFTMLAGTQFRLTITPTGDVGRVEGIEEARKFASARVGDDELRSEVSASAVTDASIRGLFLSVLGPAPYPKGPVTKATKWTNADRLEFNSWDATYEISRELSVSSASADGVRVTGRGTARLVDSMNVALLPFKMVKSAKSSVDSDWTISAKDGLPVAGKDTLALDATLAAGKDSIKASHRATFSVTRLGAPPPAAVRPRSGARDAQDLRSRAAAKLVETQASRRREREADGTRGAWGVSANGALIAAGNPTCDVEVWRPDSPAPVAVLKGHTTLVTDVAVDATTMSVFALAEDGTIRIWDLKNGKQVGLLGTPNATYSLQGTPVPAGYNDVECSPDGRYGAYVRIDLSIWDASTRSWMKPRPYVAFPREIHFLADSRRLLVFGMDQIALFDLQAAPVPVIDPLENQPTGKTELRPLWTRRKPMFGGNSDRPDGLGPGDVAQIVPLEREDLVVALVRPDPLGDEGPTMLRAWTLGTGAKKWEVPTTASALVAAPRAPWIAVCDGTAVKLLSPRDGKLLRTLSPGPQSRTPQVFAPDGSAWFDADAAGQLLRVPIEDPNTPPPARGGDKK